MDAIDKMDELMSTRNYISANDARYTPI